MGENIFSSKINKFDNVTEVSKTPSLNSNIFGASFNLQPDTNIGASIFKNNQNSKIFAQHSFSSKSSLSFSQSNLFSQDKSRFNNYSTKSSENLFDLTESLKSTQETGNVFNSSLPTKNFQKSLVFGSVQFSSLLPPKDVFQSEKEFFKTNIFQKSSSIKNIGPFNTQNNSSVQNVTNPEPLEKTQSVFLSHTDNKFSSMNKNIFSSKTENFGFQNNQPPKSFRTTNQDALQENIDEDENNDYDSEHEDFNIQDEEFINEGEILDNGNENGYDENNNINDDDKSLNENNNDIMENETEENINKSNNNIENNTEENVNEFKFSTCATKLTKNTFSAPSFSTLSSSTPPKKQIQLTSSVEIQLSDLTSTPAETSLDKYNVLDQRDKLLKVLTKESMASQGIDSKDRPALKATCEDMCPEKERYMREARRRLSIYEVIDVSERNPRVDHMKAVKEYSRSSADQDLPLDNELRPPRVLDESMCYLIREIVSLAKKSGRDWSVMGGWAEWFDFLWNRMRAIRKDITQQQACNETTVKLVEQSARFHIVCSELLCEEEAGVFDQKINSENLTKCLQTLKEMYADLLHRNNITLASEAEFRAYILLMNLNNGDVLRESQGWREEVRKSPQVLTALKLHSALNNNNYIRFFKIVKAADFLTSCILHRYFNQVRCIALKRIIKVYNLLPSFKALNYPLNELIENLGFDDIYSLQSFLLHFNMNLSNISDNDTRVIVNNRVLHEGEGALQGKRSMCLVACKMDSSLSQVIYGKELPMNVPKVKPHFSFDSSHYYIVDNNTLQLTKTLQQHQSVNTLVNKPIKQKKEIVRDKLKRGLREKGGIKKILSKSTLGDRLKEGESKPMESKEMKGTSEESLRKKLLNDVCVKEVFTSLLDELIREQALQCLKKEKQNDIMTKRPQGPRPSVFSRLTKPKDTPHLAQTDIFNITEQPFLKNNFVTPQQPSTQNHSFQPQSNIFKTQSDIPQQPSDMYMQQNFKPQNTIIFGEKSNIFANEQPQQAPLQQEQHQPHTPLYTPPKYNIQRDQHLQAMASCIFQDLLDEEVSSSTQQFLHIYTEAQRREKEALEEICEGVLMESLETLCLNLGLEVVFECLKIKRRDRLVKKYFSLWLSFYKKRKFDHSFPCTPNLLSFQHSAFLPQNNTITNNNINISNRDTTYNTPNRNLKVNDDLTSPVAPFKKFNVINMILKVGLEARNNIVAWKLFLSLSDDVAGFCCDDGCYTGCGGSLKQYLINKFHNKKTVIGGNNDERFNNKVCCDETNDEEEMYAEDDGGFCVIKKRRVLLGNQVSTINAVIRCAVGPFKSGGRSRNVSIIGASAVLFILSESYFLQQERRRFESLFLALPNNPPISLVILKSNKTTSSQSQIVQDLNLASLVKEGRVCYCDIVYLDCALSDLHNAELSDQLEECLSKSLATSLPPPRLETTPLVDYYEKYIHSYFINTPCLKYSQHSVDYMDLSEMVEEYNGLVHQLQDLITSTLLTHINYPPYELCDQQTDVPCVWWNSEAYLSSLKLLSKLLLLPTYSNIDNKKNKISINKNNKNNNNNSNNNNGEHNGEYTEEVCLEMINALNSYVGSVVGGADSSMLTNNINLTLKVRKVLQWWLGNINSPSRDAAKLTHTLHKKVLDSCIQHRIAWFVGVVSSYSFPCRPCFRDHPVKATVCYLRDELQQLVEELTNHNESFNLTLNGDRKRTWNEMVRDRDENDEIESYVKKLFKIHGEDNEDEDDNYQQVKRLDGNRNEDNIDDNKINDNKNINITTNNTNNNKNTSDKKNNINKSNTIIKKNNSSESTSVAYIKEVREIVEEEKEEWRRMEELLIQASRVTFEHPNNNHNNQNNNKNNSNNNDLNNMDNNRNDNFNALENDHLHGSNTNLNTKIFASGDDGYALHGQFEFNSNKENLRFFHEAALKVSKWSKNEITLNNKNNSKNNYNEVNNDGDSDVVVDVVRSMAGLREDLNKEKKASRDFERRLRSLLQL